MKKYLIEVSEDGTEFQNICNDYVYADTKAEALGMFSDWVEEASEHTETINDFLNYIRVYEL